MTKKGSPKYPNRERTIRRRLLSQFLLLFAVAAGIGFYFYIHHSGPDEGSTLFNLGLSIGDARKQTESRSAAAGSGEGADPPVVKGEISREVIAAPSSPPPAAGTGQHGETAGPSFSAPVSRETLDIHALPDGDQIPGQPSLPSPTIPEDSPPDRSGAAAPPEETPDDQPGGSKTEGPGDMPFDDLSIPETAAELSRKYRGAPSGRWGERVTGVTTHLELNDDQSDDSPMVIALTFDACGGGRDGYDAELIDFLREQRIPATLFVTSMWLHRHPEILRELAADPLFEIAAHGERHRPCSVDGKSAYGIRGTASMEELVREVLTNAREIAAVTGRNPLWFRSGTAFYDELAVEVIQDLGMSVAGYSIAADQGATLSAAKVEARTLQAQNGDILLFHMNKPRSGTRTGVMRAIPVLQERGARFVRLSDKY